MEIRFAINEDIPGILALLQQVGQLHYEGRPDIFRTGAQKYGPSQVMAMLNKPGTPIFIAAEDEKVLGYCFCVVKKHEKDPVFNDYTELYIDDLCIDAACRRRGVGKALYEAARRYAKQRGCHNVTLNVWNFNEDALEFYKSCGMQPQRIFMEQRLED